jgi:zinc-binding in reverse transcriptase
LHFPLVYAKVKNDRATLAQVWNLDNIKLHLTRGVSSAMRVEKNKLLLLLRYVQFQLQPDSAIWHLEKSDLYIVHSLYKFLNSSGIYSPLTRSVWALMIPLKIKIFLWLAIHKKILTRDNLLKRCWVSPNTCPFCTGKTTINHLFFKCPLTGQIWHLLLQLFSHGRGFLSLHSILNFWQVCLQLPLRDMNF